MTKQYAIHKSDSALTGMHKILQTECEKLSRFSKAFLSENNSEDLHQLRVCLRKTRAALKLFHPILNNKDAVELDAFVREINQQLGVARDFDVWLAFLKQQIQCLYEVSAPNQAFELNDYLDQQEQLREQELPQYCFLLEGSIPLKSSIPIDGDHQADLGERLAMFVSLVGKLARTAPSPDYASFVSCRLYPLILKQRKNIKLLVNSNGNSNDIHRLENIEGTDRNTIHKFRKTCRRIRYWSEFAEVEKSAIRTKVTKKFKVLAGALGNIRDLDLHRARLEASNLGCRARLLEVINEGQQASWKECRSVFAFLEGKSYRKKLKAELGTTQTRIIKCQ